MPHYFIDTTDGHFHARDEEGSEFTDLDAARCEAINSLPGIAAGRSGTMLFNVMATVRDAAGMVLYRATLAVTEQWMITASVETSAPSCNQASSLVVHASSLDQADQATGGWLVS